MAKLTKSDVLALTDNIAYTYRKFVEHIGSVDNSSSLLGYLAANLNRIKNFADPQKQRYIQDQYLWTIEQVNPDAILANYFRGIISALHMNLGESVSEFWAKVSDGTRLAPEFAILSLVCGLRIDSKLVFPPVTRLATFIKNNPEGNDFIDGASVNKDLFGPAAIKIVVEDKGSGDMNVVVNGIDELGMNNTWTATIPANSSPGVEIDLVNANNFRCYDVTNITVTGGSSGDKFYVDTKADRTINP